jgi:predicted DNA-binding transcriptional regulator AlpA
MVASMFIAKRKKRTRQEAQERRQQWRDRHPPPGRMLRTPEAADYCNSSESTFNKMRLTGKGPRFIKMGHIVVYDVTDLDAWLQALKRSSTSEYSTRELPLLP